MTASVTAGFSAKVNPGRNLTQTSQNGLGICFRPKGIAWGQAREKTDAEIPQYTQMVYSAMIACNTDSDFKRFGRGLPSGLKSVGKWRLQPPIAPPLGIALGGHVDEGCIQRLNHPLGGAVQCVKLSGDLLETYAPAPGSIHPAGAGIGEKWRENKRLGGGKREDGKRRFVIGFWNFGAETGVGGKI